MIAIISADLEFGPLNLRRLTRRIIIHHSASADVSAGVIHCWHLLQGWSGISYHFIIRQDGTIEAGRPVEMIGAHAGPEVNGDSIGISLTGNFMDYALTNKQLQSLINLVLYLRELYPDGLTVWRHKDVAATDCPGEYFPWQELTQALNDSQSSDNEGGNSVEPWKDEIMTQAAAKRLITEVHNPDEPAPKWFVLAVGLRILQEVEQLGQKE